MVEGQSTIYSLQLHGRLWVELQLHFFFLHWQEILMEPFLSSYSAILRLLTYIAVLYWLLVTIKVGNN